MIVLEPYVVQESEFVRNLLTKPRGCYHPCFKNCTEESMKLMHPEGNLLAILQDVSEIENNVACVFMCVYQHLRVHLVAPAKMPICTHTLFLHPSIVSTTHSGTHLP